MTSDTENTAKRMMLPMFGMLLFLPVIATFFNPDTNWVAFAVRFAVFAALMFFTFTGKRWAQAILLFLLLLGGLIGLIAGMQGGSDLAVIHLILGMINLAGGIILFRNKAIKAYLAPPVSQADIDAAIGGELKKVIEDEDEEAQEE
jgi:hypothetical protein